ncbi:MAG: glycosyltransferase family 4 protein [Anaerolineae bacterium]|nr:glycosyltransferase family 4 protein [Anaerolineae bacterium]
MDILHVVHGYYPALGGSERMIQCISENLVSRYGDAVTVYTMNAYNAEGFVDPRQPLLPVDNFVLNDVEVQRFAVFNRLGPLLFRLQGWAYNLRLPFNQYLRTWYVGPIAPGLKQKISAYHSDVVCAAAFPLLHMYTTLAACKQSGKPCVLVGALHPLDPWGFQRPMIYEAIRQADAYIALSQYEKQYLVDEWEIPASKIAVIGVGIDAELFDGVDGANIRQRYHIDDRPLIAFIGQQGGHKGIDTLLLAMKVVWNELPEARLLISGAPTHYTSHLNKLVERYFSPIERARIIHLGSFSESEKPYLFAACDVFAYPSRFESFGIAFIEAWASGKPVVGCDSGAIPTVVSDGVDGLLVTPGDSIALGMALLKLLVSPELRRQMGEAGRQKVLQNYTWEVVTRRWRDVYQKVLS